MTKFSSPAAPPIDPRADPERLARARVRAYKRCVALTLLLAAATLLSAFARLFWVAELFTHFTLHYAVMALVLMLGFTFMRRWRWAALAAALVLYNGYPVAHYLLQDAVLARPGAGAGGNAGAEAGVAAGADVGAPRHFTVFHLNAYFRNEDPRFITVHLRRARDIDVVVLLEASARMAAVLDDIKDIYPYQVRDLLDSPAGIALASRLPLEHSTVVTLSAADRPYIAASIRLPGRAEPLALYAVHARSPISGTDAAARNALLAHIAQDAANHGNETPLVVGDFNLTPWSPYFRQFIGDSGLRAARLPHHLDNTWPVTFNSAWLGLPIDHSFAHPALALVNRVVGPDLHSDHMPVTATFAY